MIFKDREMALMVARQQLADEDVPEPDEALEDDLDEAGLLPGGHIPGDDCWCEPQIEHHPGGRLVIHRYAPETSHG